MSRIMNVGLRPLRVGKFSTLVRPKNLLLLGGLFLFAVGILIFGLMHGSFSVPASEVGRALFSPENVSTDARYIVQDIRLPRVIMALLCGAMLGMAVAVQRKRDRVSPMRGSVLQTKRRAAWQCADHRSQHPPGYRSCRNEAGSNRRCQGRYR